MNDYIDNVVLRLKREYSKDELVAHLLKKQSELEIEIGILKSEKDEIHYKLVKILKLDSEVKSRLAQTKLYQNMKVEIKALTDKCRKLKLENTKLFSQLVKSNN